MKKRHIAQDHADWFGIYQDDPQKYYNKYGNTSPSDQIRELNPNSPAAKALGEAEKIVEQLRPEIEELIKKNSKE